MGVMTLKEFREEVAGGLQRGTPDDIGKPRLDRWIHNAMYEFGYAFKFRELEGAEEQTLEIDTNTVTFPTHFRMLHEAGIEVLGVERYEGKLLPETRSEYIKYNRTVGAFVRTGRPLYYHIFGTNFNVRPVADQEYSLLVHYWKLIQPIVAESDVSIFQPDWDDIIMNGALYRGFKHFNEFDRYQNVRNDFLGLIRSRKMEEDLEEFPEGGIHPTTYRDTEDPSFYGLPGRDERSYGEFHG